MKRVFVLRHAKSDWADPGLSDHDRPLAPRGGRGADLLAAHVRDAGIAPDVVLCSTALRARQTFERVAKGLPAGTTVYHEPRLYGPGPDELIRRLQELPDDVASAMLVGHNPGLEELVLELAADGSPGLLERVETKFPTAALATLDAAVDKWSDINAGTATLTALVTPSDLG